MTPAKSMPSQLPFWEFPAVIGLFLGLGTWVLDWSAALSIAFGTAAFLLRYLANERDRWEVLVEIVVNTNLGGLEVERRLQGPVQPQREWVEIPFTEQEEVGRHAAPDYFSDKRREDKILRDLYTGPIVLDTFDRRDAAASLRTRGQIEVHKNGQALVALLTESGRQSATPIWAAFEASQRKHGEERHEKYFADCLVCQELQDKRGRAILAEGLKIPPPKA